MANLTDTSGTLTLVTETGDVLTDDTGGLDLFALISEILAAIDTLDGTGGSVAPPQPLLPQACL